MASWVHGKLGLCHALLHRKIVKLSIVQRYEALPDRTTTCLIVYLMQGDLTCDYAG